ncbi:hypothetical protein LC048_09975 [Mesobacillus subterraneus]|uniref:hypothetical protein n=1 Tax=Mesobacillus subterraneus TaxID=285983 RepID=UPI00273F9AF7|nr:hypothetical protein [Mesobacillus subterraneus]WLR57152.1 hypothetical protein LC048_09975 [Mesobacillus subterraneus]
MYNNGVFITIAAGAGILFAIAYFSTNRVKKKVLMKENIPEHLGLLADVPGSNILNKLEKSLSYDFLNQVKLRFLSEHPEISDDEFEWRLFELKRYFFLNSFMKSTPMFSSKIDEVWHEMLMFTKQYEVFSEKYLGSMLHHTPNLEPEPAPQQRAIFDWVFSQLFEITEYTWQTWGDFFHYPLDQQLLQKIDSLSDDELKQQFFKVTEDNQELVNYLTKQFRSQLRKTQEMYKVDRKGYFERPGLYGDLSGLSLVMVFYSYHYFDEYWKYTQEYAYSHQTQGTSGCTAVFCGSGDLHDSNNDGVSHSCSSSSCSSCGGGCSS